MVNQLDLGNNKDQKQKQAKSALQVIEINVHQGQVKTARTKQMTNV